MLILVKILNSIKRAIKRIYLSHYRNNLGSGGKTVIFYGRSLPIIKGEGNIFLGKDVKLNEYSYLYARGNSKIIIGNNVSISSFAKLITAQYDLEKWINHIQNEDIHIEKDIIIGNNCWIASGAIILPGVRIEGTNVVVAAGSVVTRSFQESNIIIGGSPAKIIKHI